MPRTARTPAAPTFEESIGRLEEIIEAMERGEPSLADSLALYQEGVELAERCRVELQSAELRVRELSQRAGVEEAFGQ